MSKKIALLGSTGSIGTQTLDIVRMHPDKFDIVALTAGSNINLLEAQISEFEPLAAVIGSKEDAERLKSRVRGKTVILHGFDGIEKAIEQTDAEIVLNALVGSRGLIPTCRALEAGKNVALANKESLVAGGQLVTRLASMNHALIVPVDSEHSAIFQCLQGQDLKEVKKIILTASGGPFRQLSKAKICLTSVKDALKHPNWSMGHKITIDSATMMNKGLEIIEAAWLFDITLEQIDVVVHPQSIVHSMVEFSDTSVMAQLGLPDMRVPIQYALSYPVRINNTFESLDFIKLQQLTFECSDENRFPCLRLAKEAMKIGKTMPCVLNAANDILVEAYLQRKIDFYGLAEEIEKTMYKHEPYDYNTLEDLMEVEAWVKSTLASYQ